MTICNISERGMMLKGDRIPARGSIIEIRSGATSIAAEVRWSATGRCGVRSRERIDVIALLNGGGLKSPMTGGESVDQRAQVRTVDRRIRLEHSQCIGRLVDRGLVLVLIVTGAAILFVFITSVLSSPFESLQTSMGG